MWTLVWLWAKSLRSFALEGVRAAAKTIVSVRLASCFTSSKPIPLLAPLMNQA
jgi:hypothetical protein